MADAIDRPCRRCEVSGERSTAPVRTVRGWRLEATRGTVERLQSSEDAGFPIRSRLYSPKLTIRRLADAFPQKTEKGVAATRRRLTRVVPTGAERAEIEVLELRRQAVRHSELADALQSSPLVTGDARHLHES